MDFRNILVPSLLIALMVVNSVNAEANYVLELNQGINNVFKSIEYNDLIIINVDGKAFIVNLTSYEVYELVANAIIDHLTSSGSSLIGIGRLNESPIILDVYDLSSVLAVKLGVNSTLYDVVKLNDYLLAVGYVVLDNVYRLVIHNLSRSNPYSYVADCRTSCYGRKLIVSSSNTLITGSAYLKSGIYGWNYDVFVGRLEDAFVDGIYIELDGNNFVVNAFMFGDLLYVVINSDPSGVYLAAISLPNLRIDAYRISLGTTSVRCLSALSRGDEVIMLIEDLVTGGRYLTVLNVSTLSVNAYDVGNASSVTVFKESVLTFNILNELKGVLIINDVGNLRKALNEVKVSLNAIKVKSSEIRFNLVKQPLTYDVNEHHLGMKYVGRLLNASTQISTSSGNVSYSKPLYELRSRAMGRNEYILVIGLAFIITSITLKYLINLKGYRS